MNTTKKNLFYTEIGELTVKLLCLDANIIDSEALGKAIYNITKVAIQNSDNRAQLEETEKNWNFGLLTPEEYQEQKEKFKILK